MKKHIIKYGLLIVRDGKFLVHRKRGTDWFLVPGGKPEEGETAEECLTREIREELDCAVVAGSLKSLTSFTDVAANEPSTLVTVHLYRGDVEGEPSVNAEIEEQRWWGEGDDESTLSLLIRRNMLPYFRERSLLKE